MKRLVLEASHGMYPIQIEFTMFTIQFIEDALVHVNRTNTL